MGLDLDIIDKEFNEMGIEFLPDAEIFEKELRNMDEQRQNNVLEMAKTEEEHFLKDSQTLDELRALSITLWEEIGKAKMDNEQEKDA